MMTVTQVIWLVFVFNYFEIDFFPSLDTHKLRRVYLIQQCLAQRWYLSEIHRDMINEHKKNKNCVASVTFGSFLIQPPTLSVFIFIIKWVTFDFVLKWNETIATWHHYKGDNILFVFGFHKISLVMRILIDFFRAYCKNYFWLIFCVTKTFCLS